jgi:hypothetical protein
MEFGLSFLWAYKFPVSIICSVGNLGGPISITSATDGAKFLSILLKIISWKYGELIPI